MSPDGANFLVEMFLEVKEASMQKITISALLSLALQPFEFLRSYENLKMLYRRTEKSWDGNFLHGDFPDPLEHFH